ncbi:MAG: hypothetical protein ACLQVI_27760 [Polyangiaceae bacterium]
MRIAHTVLGTFFTAAAVVTAAASGCVSNNNAPPATGVDSAFPAEDSGAPPAQDSAVSPPADAGTDATLPPPQDSGQGQDSAPAPDAADAGPQAAIRVANLTSASVTIGDVCVSPHGANTWQGPLLRGAGLTSGLPELTVSQYFVVPAGQDDLLLLPPGATTCDDDASAATEYTDLPPLAEGAMGTAVIADPAPGITGGSDIRLFALADESSVSAGEASLRLVNVASYTGSAGSLSIGTGALANPLFANITADEIIDPGADTAGYRQVGAASSIDLGFEGQGPIYVPPVALTAGTIGTLYYTEVSGDGYSDQLVYCNDGPLSPSSGGLSTCTVVDGENGEPPAYTRFANFLADTSLPSADICVKYHALSTYVGPLLAGEVDAGTTAPSLNPPSSNGGSSTAVSGYFAITGGIPYDVRYVAAGSASCATGLTASDFLYVPPVGTFALVAATGYLSVPGGAPEPGMYDAGAPSPDSGALPGLSSVAASFAVFTDDAYAGSATYVRVIHLAASNPQPFSVAAGSWGFTGIPYGTYGTQPGPDVTDGYLSVTSGGGGFEINNTIGGQNQADLSFSLSATNIATFVIFGVGGTEPFLGAVQCIDSNPTYGGVAACTSLGGG